jgi:Mce-associated membrane protein
VASARSGDELRSPARAVRILVVLAVLGVVVGVAGLLVPRVAVADDDAGDRKEVVSRATDFAVTYNTYDVAAKDDYQERMKGLLTPAYFTEFTKVTDAVFDALTTKKQKSGDAKVIAVAVDSIDDDSAVALVAVNAAISNTDEKAAVERRFRWKVTFSREGDEWLVSQFETVPVMQAEAGDPSATPAPAPEEDSP